MAEKILSARTQFDIEFAITVIQSSAESVEKQEMHVTLIYQSKT